MMKENLLGLPSWVYNQQLDVFSLAAGVYAPSAELYWVTKLVFHNTWGQEPHDTSAFLALSIS